LAKAVIFHPSMVVHSLKGVAIEGLKTYEIYAGILSFKGLFQQTATLLIF
jgi:hypothetical protein